MENKMKKIFNPTEYAQLWERYYDNQAKTSGYGSDLGVYRNPDGIRVLASLPKSTTRPTKALKPKKQNSKLKPLLVKKKKVSKPKPKPISKIKSGDVFRKLALN